MTLTKLEQQVLYWNKAAILAPVFFTGLLMLAYTFEVCTMRELFFIACGLYFFTAIIWWWWTMKSIQYLVKVLQKTSDGITETTQTLKQIREDIEVDRRKNN